MRKWKAEDTSEVGADDSFGDSACTFASPAEKDFGSSCVGAWG